MCRNPRSVLEKRPLNSCVQPASAPCADGASPRGSLGILRVVCNIMTQPWVPVPSGPCVPKVSHESDEGKPGCTLVANSGCPMSYQESRQWGECLAVPTTAPVPAVGGERIHRDEGAPCPQSTVGMLGTDCLQQCWETQNNPTKTPRVS